MTILNETAYEEDLAQLGLNDLSDLSRVTVLHIITWSTEQYITESRQQWRERVKKLYSEYNSKNTHTTLLAMKHSERISLRQQSGDISRCLTYVMDKHKADLLKRMSVCTPYHIQISDHYKVI